MYYSKKQKKNLIYNLQVVPINCDYEILSHLMWVVVNIWALPYGIMLVPFVYFWNKIIFKMLLKAVLFISSLGIVLKLLIPNFIVCFVLRFNQIQYI